MSETTRKNIQQIEQAISDYLVIVTWAPTSEIEKINAANKTAQNELFWQFGI